MVDNDLDLGRIDPINELDLDFHKTYKLAKFQNFSLKTATCVPQKQVLTNTHTKKTSGHTPVFGNMVNDATVKKRRTEPKTN